MVPALVELALAYYRNPVAYGHIADVSRPLPRGFAEFLTEFGAALSASRIEQTSASLGTDVRELEDAARFFARHVLLDPAGDYYRYLGLFRDATPEAIRGHYLLLIRMFHPDRLVGATDADLAYSSRLNAAYHVLRDPEERARYDQGLPKACGRRSRKDPRLFFKPAPPIIDTKTQGHWPRWRGALPTRGLWLGLAIAGLLGTGYLLLRPAPEPVLRLTGNDPIATDTPLPKYLAATGTMPNDDQPSSPAGEFARATPDLAKNPKQDQPDEAGQAENSSTSAGKPGHESAGDLNAARERNTSPPPANTQVVAAPTLPIKAPVPNDPEPRPRLTEKPPSNPRERREAEIPKRLTPTPVTKPAKAPEPIPAWNPPAPSTSAPSVMAAAASAPPPPKPSKTAPAPVEVGARVTARLESAYGQGNADAVAALFTQSARTSDGNGRHLLRVKYDRLFRANSAQQLVYTSMRWQSDGAARIKGSGRFSVSMRDKSTNAWRRSRGRIQIELVPDGTDYRISTMFYQLD